LTILCVDPQRPWRNCAPMWQTYAVEDVQGVRFPTPPAVNQSEIQVFFDRSWTLRTDGTKTARSARGLVADLEHTGDHPREPTTSSPTLWRTPRPPAGVLWVSVQAHRRMSSERERPRRPRPLEGSAPVSLPVVGRGIRRASRRRRRGGPCSSYSRGT